MASTSTVIARLWLAVFCGYTTLGATIQLLPGYLTSRFHAGPLAVGICVGVAFAASAVFRPIAGRRGDLGLSQRTATAGAVLTAVGALGHLVAPGLWAIVVARLAMGVGEAALFSGTLPWVLRLSTGSGAARQAGWFGLSMWSGLSCGPLLATVLSSTGGSDRAAWLTVAALPVASIVLVTGLRDTTEATAPERSSILPSGWHTPGAILGLAAYGYGTIASILVLYLAGRRSNVEGLALAVFSLAFLVIRAAGSPAVDRIGGARVAVATMLVSALGLAVLPLLGDPTVLAAIALAGAGVALIYPATSRMTLRSAAQHNAGAAMGAMTSLWDLGILVAGPVSGTLVSHAGYTVAFEVAAAAAAVGAGIAAASAGPGRRFTAGARLSRATRRSRR
ncbi:MFS transporter [Tsukamurella sp. 8F]|uniref:MFS transporter n=1 Tax=unclassified Tsukamurella TaxID=2633480 RepID=UPI0023B99A11|nr:MULTISPECIES: MFS transporter [unclassified Tsukamurella]MDF0530061.1 MFS transporter [Tsukamurella sp. 8J]MDF0586379.1 MFS transporter [Tsukamurella sp. 8F]